MDDPWNLRGYEHGPDIFAWVLGERIITPRIPDNAPEDLVPSFELLTGVALPTQATID